MEARAINRYIGSSPRKMRLVIDLIRGKSVDEALHILHFSPKHASKIAEKVLRSAVSNLQNKDEAGRVDPGELVVKQAYVDGGMTMKRISPAPMGRAYRIRKRSNHVTIVVAVKEPVKRAAGKAAPAKKSEPRHPKGETAPEKVETETKSRSPKKKTKKEEGAATE
jgi:large subunit ribosomal protein L22